MVIMSASNQDRDMMESGFYDLVRYVREGDEENHD